MRDNFTVIRLDTSIKNTFKEAYNGQLFAATLRIHTKQILNFFLPHSTLFVVKKRSKPVPIKTSQHEKIFFLACRYRLSIYVKSARCSCKFLNCKNEQGKKNKREDMYKSPKGIR